MTTRVKNALKVFIFLAVSFVIAVSIDYTDTYVADRFHKTLASDQYELGEPISLDRYIEYYDWDTVHVVLPDQEPPDLSTIIGLAHKHKAGGDVWTLVFVKDDYVIAEIPIKREVLEHPKESPTSPYERWQTIIAIIDENGTKRLEFVGE